MSEQQLRQVLQNATCAGSMRTTLISPASVAGASAPPESSGPQPACASFPEPHVVLLELHAAPPKLCAASPIL